MDDSSNPKGGGAGIILKGPGDINLEHSLKFDFKASNNQVEFTQIPIKNSYHKSNVEMSTNLSIQ
ncbi:hypothetical protein CR513_36591, partial [Mucuna pruriens]